jgi:hypothetical protein
MKKVVVAALVAGAIGLGVGCTEKLNEPKQEIQPITKKWFTYALNGVDSIFLTPVDSVVLIRFEAEMDSMGMEQFASESAMLKDGVRHRHLSSGFHFFRTEAASDIGWLLAVLRADDRVRFAYPVFAEGECILFDCFPSTTVNQTLVKFHVEPSLRVRDSLFEIHGLRILRTPGPLNDSYLLVQEEKSTEDIFDVSNRLYETGTCNYAQPNLIGVVLID